MNIVEQSIILWQSLAYPTTGTTGLRRELFESTCRTTGAQVGFILMSFVPGPPDKLESPQQPRPLLLIKLTGYRLLTIAMITAFGTAKAVVSYQNKTIISTSLDWVMGVVLAIGRVADLTVDPWLTPLITIL
jgi:hypothetical protein